MNIDKLAEQIAGRLQEQRLLVRGSINGKPLESVRVAAREIIADAIKAEYESPQL